MLAASMVLSTLAALATPSDATQFVRLCCCRAAVGVAQVRSSGPFPPHHAPRIAIPRPHTAPRPAPPSSPPSPLPVDLPHTGRRIAASEVTLIEFSLSKGLVVIEPVWGPLSQRVHAGTCASQTTFQHRLSALKRRGRGGAQGAIFPSIHTELGKWKEAIGPQWFSTVVSIITSGMYLGSAVAMLVLPAVAAAAPSRVFLLQVCTPTQYHRAGLRMRAVKIKA
jgi:hypothetical protein